MAQAIKLQIRTDAAGTATMLTTTDLIMTVIEYDDVSAIFVEDVRIVGRELQKKIGGAWIPVSDSLATILNAIEAKADSAIATNVTQAGQIANIVTVNNTQNTRLGSIESDIVGINVLNSTQNLRLTNLENDVNGLSIVVGKLQYGGVFASNHNLTSSSYFWVMSIGSGYVAGQGFRSDSNGLVLSLTDARLDENQTTHIFASIRLNSAPTGTLQWRVNNGAYGSLNYAGVGGASEGWLRVPNTVGNVFTIEFSGFGDFYLRNLNFLGRGENNPFA